MKSNVSMFNSDAHVTSRYVISCRRLVAVVSVFLLGGCVSLEYGVLPPTDRLAELSIGESRQGDVLLALGQPRGKGAANVSPKIEPRKIWFYEFVESDGQVVRVKMLLIYFVGDVYDGYLWFSSVGDVSS